MAQFLGFGNAADGNPTLAGTESPIDSTAATDGDGIRLDATNPSFAANQLVLIHQSQGPTVGGWEVNQIKAYSAGFITPSVPLVNTYSVSGGNQHQVRTLPQYGTATISGSYTGKPWNGSTGGLLAFVAQVLNNTGTLSMDANGFRGGAGSGACNCPSNPSNCGEGSPGASVNGQTSSNGNGGGGTNGNGMDGGPSGGGGEQSGGANAGGPGQGGTPGSAGNVIGSSDCITMVFGGGGGGGRGEKNGSGNGGNGGNGGGIIFLMVGQITNSGTITSQGQVGGAASFTSTDGAGGGGAGGGGVVFIKSNVAKYDNGTITTAGASGGAPGCCAASTGGSSGSGFIRLEQCSYSNASATMTGSLSVITGGLTWCFVPGSII